MLALAAALTLALGWRPARALGAPRGAFAWLETLALAGGLGLGVAALVQMVALPLPSGLRWPVEAVVAAALLALPTPRRDGGVQAPPPGAAPGRAARCVDVALGCALALLAAQHARAFYGLTLAQPHGDWDAKAIWNLKARFLFRADSDWAQAASPELGLAHSDYPWLVPLVVARGFWALGRESAWLTAALHAAFWLATLTVLVTGLRRARGPLAGWLGGFLLLASTAFTRQAGAQQADVPLGFFVLVMTRALAAGGAGPAPLALAGIAGALAAFTKNEGAVWAACFGLALPFGRRGADTPGRLARPAWFLAGAAPALLVVAYFKLAVAGRNDWQNMAVGSTLQAHVLDMGRWATTARALWAASLDFVPLGAAALLVVPFLASGHLHARTYGSARPALGVGLCTIALAAIFVVTPADLKWQLDTSVARVLLQLWPAAIYVSLACWPLRGAPAQPPALLR